MLCLEHGHEQSLGLDEPRGPVTKQDSPQSVNVRHSARLQTSSSEQNSSTSRITKTKTHPAISRNDHLHRPLIILHAASIEQRKDIIRNKHSMRSSLGRLFLLLPLNDIPPREDVVVLLQLQRRAHADEIPVAEGSCTDGRGDELRVGPGTPRLDLRKKRE
jgi:hypothetical protein